jgi:hypothetical protein
MQSDWLTINTVIKQTKEVMVDDQPFQQQR